MVERARLLPSGVGTLLLPLSLLQMPPNGGISSLISALRPAATKSLQRALDTLLGVITLVRRTVASV